MKIPLGCSLAIFVFKIVVVSHSMLSGKHDLIEISTFVILALTLVALVIYAWDTNSIARVAREQWERATVLNTAYEMNIADKKGDPGVTTFRIHNPSTLVVRAKVRCHFQVYGDRVDYHPAYNGGETWYLFPQQISQGWFAIERLLQKKGKTIAQIMAERTEGNKEEQLTMDLELEFRDERGIRRVLPSRHHYFDFDRWVWIPSLTARDDWA
jgi:hypothetical protein